MSNNDLIRQYGGLISGGTLFILSGPSGCGKSTVIHELMKLEPGLRRSISVTTRAQRPGEKPMEDYEFVSEEEFSKRVEAEKFLEHATVYNHRYGTPRTFIEECLKAGSDVLLDLDINGVRQVQALKFPAVYIYLLPPDKESLRARLKGRKTDNAQEIETRFNKLEEELAEIRLYDYLVFNRTIPEAVLQVQTILASSRLKIRNPI